VRDDEFTKALAAWCRYYLETEEFDRTLTIMRDPRTGNAVIESWVRQQSHVNARAAHARYLGGYGGHEDSYHDAKRQAGRWSHEVQKQWLAEYDMAEARRRA
jgi:hypothetical protein